MARLLYSIVESPAHPNLSDLYARQGFEEVRLASQRKALAELKRRPPAVVVAEFIYAFSTYYQATNISNLDVLLQSLVKYAPATRVIVLVNKADRERVQPLQAIHPLQAVLTLPVTETEMAAALLEIPED